LMVMLLAGCTPEPPITASIPAAEAKTITPDGAVSPGVVELQLRRARLIDSVVALFRDNPERAEYLRAGLNREDVGGIGIGGNPAATRLATQIFAIRDTIRVRKAPPPINVALVTLGIPDEWSYGDASAVVVRKRSGDSRDAILIPQNATAGNIAQAIRVFAALDTSITAPKTEGAYIVVYGTRVPPSWIAQGGDKSMNAELDDLRRRPSKRSSLGMMRTTEISILVDSRKASKP
ncbi:MAG: hypothetical protein ABJE47_16225, partial [bacterium]